VAIEVMAVVSMVQNNVVQAEALITAVNWIQHVVRTVAAITMLNSATATVVAVRHRLDACGRFEKIDVA
jgi:hypothetical protein